MVTRSELRNVLALVVVTTVVSSLVVAPVFASDEVRESAQDVNPYVTGPSEDGGAVAVVADGDDAGSGEAVVGVNNRGDSPVAGGAASFEDQSASAIAGADGATVNAAGESRSVEPPIDPDAPSIDPSNPPDNPNANVQDPAVQTESGVGAVAGGSATLDEEDGPGTDLTGAAGANSERAAANVESSGSEGDVQASSATQPNEQTTQNRFAARDGDGDRLGSAWASRTDPSWNEDVTIVQAGVGFGQGVEANHFTLYRAGVVAVCDDSERLRDRCKFTNEAPSMARMFPPLVRDTVALKDTPANITWGNALGIVDLVWKTPSGGMGTIVYPVISDSAADPPAVNPEEDYPVNPANPPGADDVDPNADPHVKSPSGDGAGAYTTAQATDNATGTAAAGVNNGGDTPVFGGFVEIDGFADADVTASDDTQRTGVSVDVGDESYGADTDDGASLPVEE